MNKSHHLRNALKVVPCVVVLMNVKLSSAQEASPVAPQPVGVIQQSNPRINIQENASQLLQLSAEIVEKMKSEGLSRERVAEQRKMSQQLARLLNDSSEGALQPLQAETNSTQQPDTTTDSSSGSATSGTQSDGAGLAGAIEPGTQSNSPLRLRENLADSVWGHLPPQERRDLIRTYSESFLPEYEEQVRAYFERLAKLKLQSPSSQPSRSESAN